MAPYTNKGKGLSYHTKSLSQGQILSKMHVIAQMDRRIQGHTLGLSYIVSEATWSGTIVFLP